MRLVFPIVLATAMLAGCAPPPRPAAPPPPPPRAVAATPPPPVALGPDWNDWPRTPGSWRYSVSGARGSATFGVAQAMVAALTCDRSTGMVSLSVPADAATPITVRTSTTTRTLTSHADATTPAIIQADLPAADPLLDAIAFSRGRFTVERAGSAPLVLPPYAEIGRVIEDCRG